MKKIYLFCLGLGLAFNASAQYEGFSLGVGYTVSPNTFSPAIFNTSVVGGQVNESVTLEKETVIGGSVPIEMELFMSHFMMNISGAVPIGMTSKGKEFMKMYDTDIFKISLAGGAWIKNTFGVFGGLHYNFGMYKIKNFSSIRFNNVQTFNEPIISDQPYSQNYYIGKMNINSPGVNLHFLYGEKFLLMGSVAYDFVRLGKKASRLGDRKVTGYAITPEISFYFPFDDDKNFGMYVKAAYKHRVIKGLNDFVMDNSGQVPGYFPSLKNDQFLFTVGLMLPPGIFGSATSTRRVTTITIIE